MSTFDEMSALSDVARVGAVDSDGCRLYLEYRNGQTATVNGSRPFEFEIGSVVLVRHKDNHIEKAPNELWSEKSWIGVVRLKRDDVTLIYSQGQLKKFPTHDRFSYEVGNTVEAQDAYGVVSVLSEKPIKDIDINFSAIDDTIIDKFKSLKGTKKEKFEDFGGYKNVVARARKLIEVPLKKREALLKIGARPIKGVLFTGRPGTGKTMLARIIANSTASEFYEISGPEIFSKWYGQSEEVLRKLFEDAARQESAIIFFDEIDSVAGQRADESHEASRRVVAQLLTLMDGFESDNNVIVIATTNRPQDIDVALRRPGRFDWEINFPLPDQSDRESILRISAKHLLTHGDLSHKKIAENTKAWSSADLTAIWTEAALLAVEDNRNVIMEEDYIGGFEIVLAQKRQLEEMSLGGDLK